jgi:hypothetical protein
MDGEWTSGSVVVKTMAATTPDPDSLWIFVVVMERDPKRRFDFRGWRRSGFNARGATLVDDNGNQYPPKGFDLLDALVVDRLREAFADKKMGFGPGPVDASRPRAELLMFDHPVPAAQHLDLDLDLAAVGQSGKALFRIPRAEWKPERH